MGALSRLKHAWNAFLDQDDSFRGRSHDFGAAYGVRPDRVRLRISNERSIVSAIYTRLAIDFASIDIRHVRLDEDDRYVEDIKSGLNNCLTLEANLDQMSQHFFIDAALTMFDEGTIALVPVDTSVDPSGAGSIDIQTMRVGKIVQWYPKHVRVDLYNELTGRREEVTLEKKIVAIIENPLYSVMNEPNSTLQRLIRKLNLLDAVDEQSSSGKLDLIIQLPYVIKSEARRAQAEKRREEIEFQLKGNKYGIAYTDGTEKITQLNRPAENNLLKQIEYLTEMLYGQLGLTPEIMLGTADEAAMLNYINRTLVPILTAFSQEMKRKFLSKTARTQGQSIEFFRDPFKLVPMKDLAEMADKFTRNEIVTSNEFRQFIGIKPSKDPKADELRNSNMPAPLDQPAAPETTPSEEPEDNLDPFSGINDALDEVFKSLEVPTDATG
jgi:hypothetical protein